MCVVSLHLELLVVAAEGTKIKDSESASHGAEDALHQVVDTYRFPGFEIVQFNLPVLSHYSYLLVSGPEALLVDPDRDINAYLDYAKKNNLTIKGVFLTHSHADFVAGHLETVRALQRAHLPKRRQRRAIQDRAAPGRLDVPRRQSHGEGHHHARPHARRHVRPGLREGETQPRAVFTGDTLFVGSIGRPDLLEGTMTAATLASMSFDTWHNKLSKLPDSVVVLPAHGAGSLCGANLSDDPSSTIGRERSSNPYVQKKGRSEFIAAVLEGLPEAPQYFKHNAAMNRAGSAAGGLECVTGGRPKPRSPSPRPPGNGWWTCVRPSLTPPGMCRVQSTSPCGVDWKRGSERWCRGRRRWC